METAAKGVFAGLTNHSNECTKWSGALPAEVTTLTAPPVYRRTTTPTNAARASAYFLATRRLAPSFLLCQNNGVPAAIRLRTALDLLLRFVFAMSSNWRKTTLLDFHFLFISRFVAFR
jgi:hypothetical protein